MRESGYGGTMKSKLQHEVGGQVIKIADKATLGLPDNLHIHRGLTTYIETKIGEEYEDKTDPFVKPWKLIKKNIRQFEVCKRLGKNALLLFVAYYPEIRATWVLNVRELELYEEDITLAMGRDFVWGHGIDLIARHENEYRQRMFQL